MRHIMIVGFLFIAFGSMGQVVSPKSAKFKTTKLAGTYGLGTDIEKERVGTIIVYPDSDTTVLFYIDLNRGAPSYNMGSLYGRVRIAKGEGTFQTKFDHADKGCQWTFKFLNNSLTIETISGQDECGFGFHVFADGEYKLISNKILDYFENMEGSKVYFKTIKPEDYYK